MNIKALIKKKNTGLFLSIILPIVIMVCIYGLMGIYPGSEKTILASDALSQGATFLAGLNNILHGDLQFFYNWHGSLGINFWALMSYYLNSLFNLAVFFFDNNQIPDAMYFIILLKFGAMGGTFWVMSNQLFAISKLPKILLSVTYALNGFAIAYSPQQMWLDGLIYLPLVFLGIHRILNKKGSGVLFTSYLLLFLSNFYMAFMVGVFSFLYYVCCFVSNPKKYKDSWRPYLITSFLAGGASMVTILPTIMDLKDNGESLSSISQLFTKDTGIWDLPVKTMVGIYDTSQYESSPFFYFGLLGLTFCIYYFLTKKIRRQEKILHGALIVLLVLSVYIDPLNLFWHGFHAPYMFLFRFSFLFSFFGLFLAGFGLEVISKEDIDILINILLSLIAVYAVTMLIANPKRYDFIGKNSLIVTLLFLSIYLAVFICKKKFPRKSRFFNVCFALFILLELGTNTYFLVEGISHDWSYPNRKNYDANFDDIQTLVEETKKMDNTFYRMANIDSTSRNESFVYGYSGVSMFSSIRNRHSSAYLNNLGFRSMGTNLTIQYENNTLIADALLGIKYNLSKDELGKFGFTKKDTVGEYSLYENEYALPLGILTDDGIYEEDVALNQTELLNYLAQKNETFFRFSDVELIDSENVDIEESGTDIFYSSVSPNKLRKLDYSIDVPANSQAYLSLYGLTSDIDIVLTVDGEEHRSSLAGTGQYYNLGYYQEATTIEANITLTGDKVTKMTKPNAMFLDINKFEKTMEAIKEKEVTFDVTGRKAQATVELAEDQVVWTTIPYDKGWVAYIDGKKVEIPTFKNAFLAIPVSKGKHTLQLLFLPQGIKIGAFLFVTCLIMYAFYNLWERKNRNNYLENEANDEKI